jgi:methylase of polypeptide subunit release factors
VVGRDAALLRLLQELKSRGYRFTTVTPATHERVLARARPQRSSLRDIFGWSRPFAEGDLDPTLLALLRDADAVESGPQGLRSQVRVSSLGADLFLHSAFPTESADSVFFGPDTYRFAGFIARQVPALGPVRRIVDIGTGSGAGGIAAARLAPNAEVRLIDINPEALRLARINAEAAHVPVTLEQSDRIGGKTDLILANPPYMMDSAKRAYRDGGDLLGGEIALNWVRQGIEALVPAGTMLLYTGVAFEDGEAPFIAALHAACTSAGADAVVEAIDPDVFGEELDAPPYATVERIAAIGAVIRRLA